MPELFDFFKENESKLVEKPSDKVWQRLETRLEKRARKRRRNIRFLQIGAMLLVILLLLLAAVMVWHFAKKGEKQGPTGRAGERAEQRVFAPANFWRQGG